MEELKQDAMNFYSKRNEDQFNRSEKIASGWQIVQTPFQFKETLYLPGLFIL